mmetsp:Transcript_19081/g.19806  ORF Transcript_19081/g.19806 Transcript_19081/m.19806 type:complete len:636 (+) Transcript_19081:2-1909(+)
MNKEVIRKESAKLPSTGVIITKCFDEESSPFAINPNTNTNSSLPRNSKLLTPDTKSINNNINNSNSNNASMRNSQLNLSDSNIKHNTDNGAQQLNTSINTIINNNTNANNSFLKGVNNETDTQQDRSIGNIGNLDESFNKLMTNSSNNISKNMSNSNSRAIATEMSNSLNISSISHNNTNNTNRDNKEFKENNATNIIQLNINKVKKMGIVSNPGNNKLNNSNSIILENSCNSSKTQETVVDLTKKQNQNNSSTNNDSVTVNSLRDSIKSLSINPSNISSSLKSLPSIVLKYHLDSVRTITSCKKDTVLVSAGDDLCINIWNLKEIEKSKDNEPSLILRGHSTPVFNLESAGENEFFSSGIDGVIRHWCISDEALTLSSCHSYDDVSKMEVCSWQASNEMIWSLKYHKNHLATASSDGGIRIWKVSDVGVSKGQTEKKMYTYNSGQGKCLISHITVKNFKLNLMENPTSLAWNNESSIFSSFVFPVIKLFDIETKKSILDIPITIDSSLSNDFQQANKLIYSEPKSLLISGHENKQIKFHDPRIKEGGSHLIKSIVGHTDSISCVQFGMNEFGLVSGSHDGTIRSWDMRTFNLLSDISSHRVKNDEGVLDIRIMKNIKSAVSCGADGVIKGFRYS